MQDKTPIQQYQEKVAEKLSDGDKSVIPERSLWQGRYSPKAMYGTWCLLILVSVLALVAVLSFASGSQPTVWYAVGGLILLLWGSVLVTYMYRRLGVQYELTTQRLIHREGVFMQRTDRLEVIDIEDVSYTQTIIERLLGVGTIRLSGRDQSHPQLALRGIDKVPEVASLIDDIRREERRKRSLHTR
ncbi:MAG: PH domain-containing protein [Pirellulaceae bacterium]|nr:PH domain-containing protein [Pirellulaceae bacterium]